MHAHVGPNRSAAVLGYFLGCTKNGRLSIVMERWLVYCTIQGLEKCRIPPVFCFVVRVIPLVLVLAAIGRGVGQRKDVDRTAFAFQHKHVVKVGTRLVDLGRHHGFLDGRRPSRCEESKRRGPLLSLRSQASLQPRRQRVHVRGHPRSSTPAAAARPRARRRSPTSQDAFDDGPCLGAPSRCQSRSRQRPR